MPSQVTTAVLTSAPEGETVTTLSTAAPRIMLGALQMKHVKMTTPTGRSLLDVVVAASRLVAIQLMTGMIVLRLRLRLRLRLQQHHHHHHRLRLRLRLRLLRTQRQAPAFILVTARGQQILRRALAVVAVLRTLQAR